MTIWICPECHEQLDRDGTFHVDLDAPPGRCMACGRPRLTLVEPAPEDDVESDS